MEVIKSLMYWGLKVQIGVKFLAKENLASFCFTTALLHERFKLWIFKQIQKSSTAVEK